MIEAKIDYKKFTESQCGFDDLKQAVVELTNATEEQFEQIKNEMWYNRLFDLLTFSKKNEKRLAEQVGSVAQAQQILMEILLRLSNEDTKVASLVHDNLKTIKRISEQNKYFISKLLQLENSILGIKKTTNIALLPEKIKAILSGCLYAISKKYYEKSESQQHYANNIINYLGNDATVQNIDDALEMIDNISYKKMILTCCIEYIFLQKNKMVIPENVTDFINKFDFGPKTIEQIKKQTQDTYSLRGEEGLVNKYTDKQFENINDIDINTPIELPFEEEPIKMEMSDLNISNILTIANDETKKFSYNNIHLSTYINCIGNLLFDHCVLFYNANGEANGITLKNGANLLFTDCVIICKGFDKTKFIIAEGNNQVGFNNCTFKDCSNFIESQNYIDAFKIKNCRLDNCYNGFVDVGLNNSGKCEIIDSIIVESNISDFNLSGEFYGASSMFSSTQGKTEISNLKVLEKEVFKRVGKDDDDKSDQVIDYFSIGNATVKNCSFENAAYCFDITGGEVKDCNFKDCKFVIKTNEGEGKQTINNCCFNHCTEVLFLDTKFNVSNCQFINCYNKIIIPRSDVSGDVKVEFCEFINTTFTDNLDDNSIGYAGSFSSHMCREAYGVDACITFSRNDSDYGENYLSSCVFDGVRLGADNFLIQAIGNIDYTLISEKIERSKPAGIVANIERCAFRNCSTQRETEKIIKQYVQYDTFMTHNKDFEAVSISECKGLDKINKESTEAVQVKVKTENTEGMTIGSVIEDVAMIGAAGVLLGPIIGPGLVYKYKKGQKHKSSANE